jgi:hypothetical protein
VSATKAARDFQRKTANGPFVLPVSAAAKNWRLEIPNKQAVSNLIHVSYEASWCPLNRDASLKNRRALVSSLSTAS